LTPAPGGRKLDVERRRRRKARSPRRKNGEEPMRRLQVVLAAALALGAAGAASAQTADTKSLVAMQGTCVAQFLGKPLACGPQVVYAVRTTGQEFVAFATAQGVIFFFGDQVSQPTPTDHVIAIDDSRIDLPDKEQFENNRLSGACHLTTSGAGGAITAIDCDATNLDTHEREHFTLSGVTIAPTPK
jgi:hypothetical protein